MTSNPCVVRVRGLLRKRRCVLCEKSFEDIISQLMSLANLPDNLPNVNAPTFHVDISLFDEISTLLLTSYPKSDWDDEFASQLRTKRNFIEQGLNYDGSDDVCPFCNQPYNDDALRIIQIYKVFLKEKEMQVIKQIEDMIRKITLLLSTIKEFSNSTELSNAEILKIKKYFPSTENYELAKPDTSDNIIVCFEQISLILNTKISNLSSNCFDVEVKINECKRIINDVIEICAHNMKIVDEINKIKNDSNTERLALRRDLCNAQFLRLQASLSDAFVEIADWHESLKKLSDAIQIKENQMRVSKKEVVFETLKFFLNRFFTGKYTIDKDTFQLRFQNTIQTKASSILSDGEKSIVAFCYYLASTHILISRDDDYNNLFFIIDDPISSMDFHYVYAVAQSLHDMKKYFGITTHDRIYVFTHNLEFYGIVSRNKIITQAYVMKAGRIERIQYQLLMPYESHLQDVLKIANGQEIPTHTIGNSLRHILETICRFEFPDKRLETYISENNLLSNNAYIYYLCQDLSHGAVRYEPPFDEHIITEACKVIVEFMNEKYRGQIDAISTMN